MIKFDVESVFTIQPEMKVLLDKHYDELTLNKHIIKLNPDWQRYEQKERENKLVICTARDNGVLIGYSYFFVEYHIHYQDLLVATNDVLFIDEKYRLGMTGIKFLKYCEQYLKDEGIHKITWHVKFSKDFRPILHRLGYKDEDVIVGKLL